MHVPLVGSPEKTSREAERRLSLGPGGAAGGVWGDGKVIMMAANLSYLLESLHLK